MGSELFRLKAATGGILIVSLFLALFVSQRLYFWFRSGRCKDRERCPCRVFPDGVLGVFALLGLASAFTLVDLLREFASFTAIRPGAVVREFDVTDVIGENATVFDYPATGSMTPFLQPEHILIARKDRFTLELELVRFTFPLAVFGQPDLIRVSEPRDALAERGGLSDEAFSAPFLMWLFCSRETTTITTPWELKRGERLRLHIDAERVPRLDVYTSER